MPFIDPTLTPFFNPQGVAVIGVSTNPAKLGYGIAQNLVNCGYPGALHFINPRGGSLFGRPVYSTIEQIPDPVDLAVILIPPHLVPGTLQACAARGIKAAIIASGGFREVGPEGGALEEKCLAIARQHGMRLLGPNCIGLMDTHLPLDTTFLPPPSPPAGDIAFISHSGAICAAIVDWSRGQGFGFSRLISLGNQADVTETDVLGPAAADPHSKSITLYLEGIADGRRFLETAAEISRQKPIVALKAGRSGGGQRAAASHTGAMAGQEIAYDAAFKRAGVERAETAEEMFDWARALAWCPLPQGPNVAVLTNAGGPGVLAADAVEAKGLALAPLSNNTKESLREELAAAASVQNPVDMLASATPQQYANSTRILLSDENVHAVLVIIPPPPMFSAGAVARELIPIIQMASKPVIIALLGHSLIQEALAYFRAVHIPAYTFPETAVSALAALARRTAFLARETAEPQKPPGIDLAKARELLANAAPGWLSQAVTAKLLAAYNIPTPRCGLAQNAAGALHIAEDIGYPLALKIDSPAIPHKSDIGGIALNLTNAQEVAIAYDEISQRTKTAHPEVAIQGILVQSMVVGGQEVIAGVTRDPQFGPLLMFGSGGVEVEGLQDVAFALAPLIQTEAEELLAGTWAGRKLHGYRDLPAADAAAVIDVLLRLGQLAVDHPQVSEIEINPLRVLENGVSAVDVRVRVVRGD